VSLIPNKNFYFDDDLVAGRFVVRKVDNASVTLPCAIEVMFSRASSAVEKGE
jgi:hypothetical protein